MIRTTLTRTRWRRLKGWVRRPAELPALPRDWSARCQAIRHRDQQRCRRCGWRLANGTGAIDHIIPRRLAEESSRDAEENLALTCPNCHAVKSHLVEADLFRGDPYRFWRYLEGLRLTGPIPGPEHLSEAFRRLRGLLTPA